MNRLNILDLGGMPFSQNRLKWMQDSTIDAIAMGQTINGINTYIRSGVRDVTISTDVIGNTAGIVIINGEPCAVDADTVGINTATFGYRYLEPVLTYDPAGNVTNFNSSTAQLYETTKYKVVGYSTAQSGKVDRQIPYLEDMITDMVFKTGTDATITSTLVLLDPFANIFNVNIASADTLSTIIRLDPATPVIWIKFVGSSPTDTVTVVPSSGIETPGGLSYKYRSGEWVQFVALGSNVYSLVALLPPTWTNISSFSNSWAATGSPGFVPRCKKNRDGLIVMEGEITKASYTSTTAELAFTLPVGNRPSQNQSYITTCNPGLQAYIYVNTTGEVYINIPGATATLELIHLSGIIFYTE